MVLSYIRGDSHDEGSDTKAVAPNVAKDNLSATREFWVALQRQLAAADEKDAAAFLLKTDNKLQPNLDIIFYKYWNTEQERSKDCERYITAEQSLRLFDDLVRGSEDVAIPCLKDYVKYKMVTGADDNEAIKAKKDGFKTKKNEKAAAEYDDKIKEELVGKDGKGGKIDKAIGDAKKSKNATPLECLVEEAKALGVDVAESGAEKVVEEVKAEKAEQDKTRVDGKKDDAAKEAEQAKVDKRLTDAKKEVEDAKKKAEDRKKELDKEKETIAKEVGDKSVEEFNAAYKAAIDKVLKKKDDEYRKRTFIKRNAACEEYLKDTSTGLSEEEGKTISQNDLNKIMNLTDADKFNAFAAALGFPIDCFADVEPEIKLEGDDDEPEYVKEG